jgi:hypothetical protein
MTASSPQLRRFLTAHRFIVKSSCEHVSDAVFRCFDFHCVRPVAPELSPRRRPPAPFGWESQRDVATSCVLCRVTVGRSEIPSPNFLTSPLPRALTPKSSPASRERREYRAARATPTGSRLKPVAVATQNTFNRFEFELLFERDRRIEKFVCPTLLRSLTPSHASELPATSLADRSPETTILHPTTLSKQLNHRFPNHSQASLLTVESDDSSNLSQPWASRRKDASHRSL